MYVMKHSFLFFWFQILGEQPNQINNKNDKGFTPLHIACSEDLSECVVALLCAGADMNMAGTMDDDDVSPDTLSKSPSAKCVKEILQMYPKQISCQDIKNGGTPLHWAKSRDIAVALIEAGCYIDAKNFKGDAALHIMVRHSRLDCVMSLISYGALYDL